MLPTLHLVYKTESKPQWFPIPEKFSVKISFLSLTARNGTCAYRTDMGARPERMQFGSC